MSEYVAVTFAAQAVRVIGEARTKHTGTKPMPNQFSGLTVEDPDSPLVWEWRNFRAQKPNRDRGRYLLDGLDRWDAWPGLGVPVEDIPCRWPKFDPEPDLSSLPTFRAGADWSVARVRRVPLAEPLTGIVIGQTRKVEGEPKEGGVDRYGEPDPGYLGGILRSIPLLEVALPPLPKRKARIMLVYPADAKAVTP